MKRSHAELIVGDQIDLGWDRLTITEIVVSDDRGTRVVGKNALGQRIERLFTGLVDTFEEFEKQ